MRDRMTRWLAKASSRWSVAARGRGGAEPGATSAGDRGDVPGWVLVTIMTAGLVAALWAVAGDALVAAFTSAIQDTVGGP